MTHPSEQVKDSGTVDHGVHDLTAEIGMPLARLRTNGDPPDDIRRRHPDDMKVNGNGKADPDADLLQRAKWWARLFGLDHWRIGITADAEDRQLGETSTARVRCANYYDEAIVMIRGDKPRKGLYSVDALAYSQDKSLIHEFLHLVFREMDATVDDVLQLIPDDKVREVFQGRMTMRQEQVVEKLTQVFATLVGSRGWQPDIQTPLSCGSLVIDRSILDNPTFHDKSYEPRLSSISRRTRRRIRPRRSKSCWVGASRTVRS